MKKLIRRSFVEDLITFTRLIRPLDCFAKFDPNSEGLLHGSFYHHPTMAAMLATSLVRL